MNYLQKQIKVVSSILNYSQIPNQDGRNGNDCAYSISKKIFDKSLKSFICEAIFFLDDKSFICRERNIESLTNKTFSENVAYGPLNFAVHVDKWKYLMNIFPDKWPYVAHDTHAVYSNFYREIQHLKGPNLEQ
jgi:hypothetical protein